MRTPLARALLFAAVAAAAVSAQPATRALPKVSTDSYAGRGDLSIPPAAHRAQFWYSRLNLEAPFVVQQLGIRVQRGTAVQAHTREVEIRMANTALEFGQLTRSFDGNLGPAPFTFFTRKPVNVPAVPATTDPNVAAMWFPGDAVFPFLGPHLIVDFRSGAITAGAATAIPNDSMIMDNGRPAFHQRGRAGCLGDLSGRFGGNTLVLTASGAFPNSPVLFFLGVENVTLGGAPLLPLDLGPLGLTGCHLGLEPLASALIPSDATGRAFLQAQLAVPSPSLVLIAQALLQRVQNPVQPSDFGTTNTANTTLGEHGLCNELFALGDNPSQSTLGPMAHNQAVVLLVR